MTDDKHGSPQTLQREGRADCILRFWSPGLNLHFFVSLAGAIVLCLVYTWFYEESVSDGPREDENESLLRLSRVRERLRWRLAAIAMYTILADLLFGDVRSWGIYGALLVGVVGYFTGNIVSTGFGSYEISRTQQAWHRRFAIVPALLLFYKGTDFHGNVAGTFVLGVSGRRINPDSGS